MQIWQFGFVELVFGKLEKENPEWNLNRVIPERLALYSSMAAIIKSGPLLQSLALILIKHTWAC